MTSEVRAAKAVAILNANTPNAWMASESGVIFRACDKSRVSMVDFHSVPVSEVVWTIQDVLARAGWTVQFTRYDVAGDPTCFVTLTGGKYPNYRVIGGNEFSSPMDAHMDALVRAFEATP